MLFKLKKKTKSDKNKENLWVKQECRSELFCTKPNAKKTLSLRNQLREGGGAWPSKRQISSRHHYGAVKS